MIENGENDEENIGKLELCHYAVQTCTNMIGMEQR
jgi:hypothetical protein